MRFLCGAVEVMKHERWTFKAAGGLYLSRQQLPLKLAWAISIHKSQVRALLTRIRSLQATDLYLTHRYSICVSSVLFFFSLPLADVLTVHICLFVCVKSDSVTRSFAACSSISVDCRSVFGYFSQQQCLQAVCHQH